MRQGKVGGRYVNQGAGGKLALNGDAVQKRCAQPRFRAGLESCDAADFNGAGKVGGGELAGCQVPLQDLAGARALFAQDQRQGEQVGKLCLSRLAAVGARAVVGGLRRRDVVPRCERRRANRRDRFVREGLRGKGAVVKRTFYQRKVYRSGFEGLQEPLGVAHGEEEVRLGVRGEVGGQDAGHHVVADGAGGPKPHWLQIGRAAGELAGLGLQALLVVGDAGERLVQQAAGWRDDGCAAALLEQARLVMALERADVLGHGRLRDVQVAGSGGKAAAAAYFQKRESARVEHGSLLVYVPA